MIHDRPIRFAVVGLGDIAQSAILPAFANAEGCELAALVSGSTDKRDVLARRYQVEHSVDYDDYDDLLATGEIDAVYITVPNHLHCDFTVRAAEAGVHVLCEKPMAVTADECRQMVDACAAADVRLMIAYRLHFERANLEVADLVAAGDLGEPRVFASVFTQDVEDGDIRLNPIEKGGGTVYDLGVYCINAARYLFRDEPCEVVARSASREDDDRFADCDEMTSAVLRFSGDRLAAFTTSFGAARVNSFEVVGTEGSLRMDPAYDYATNLTYTVTAGERSYTKRLQPRDQFGPEMVYFADCVRQDREPEPGGREGLIDVAVVEAIYESARTGQPVALDLPAPRQRPDTGQVITRPAASAPSEV